MSWVWHTHVVLEACGLCCGEKEDSEIYWPRQWWLTSKDYDTAHRWKGANLVSCKKFVNNEPQFPFHFYFLGFSDIWIKSENRKPAAGSGMWRSWRGDREGFGKFEGLWAVETLPNKEAGSRNSSLWKETLRSKLPGLHSPLLANQSKASLTFLDAAWFCYVYSWGTYI